MDRGAWWAAVHRVAQSRTGLKRLSPAKGIEPVEKTGKVAKGMGRKSGKLREESIERVVNTVGCF